MASLANYLEGVARVPLSLLTSTGFGECPAQFSEVANGPDFAQFLTNPGHMIIGLVNSATLDGMLRTQRISRAEFRQTLSGKAPLLNDKHIVECLLGQHCIDKAKEALGGKFECKVNIYCVPPGMSTCLADHH